MTRAEALAELRRLIAEAKASGAEGTEGIEIVPELQCVANNNPRELMWEQAHYFGVEAVENWTAEVERSIAKEIARKLTA